ncbi:MAG: response regulator [Bacteroidota bacterium]
MKDKAVLVIDDDPNFVQLVKYHLIKDQIPVQVRPSKYYDPKEIVLEDISLIVSDFFLPGTNGIELFKHIKYNSRLDNPLFILLAQEFDELNFQQAAELGIKDFFIKPIRVNELIKSIKILLKMEGQNSACNDQKEAVRLVENVQVDNNFYKVVIEGSSINFSQIEFQLFKLFIYNPGKVFTFGQLYLEMNAFGFILGLHSIRFQIELLKRKLDGFSIDFKDVNEIGYKLELEGRSA